MTHWQEVSDVAYRKSEMCWGQAKVSFRSPWWILQAFGPIDVKCFCRIPNWESKEGAFAFTKRMEIHAQVSEVVANFDPVLSRVLML
jgi:hypothetical protein